ncbi:MAG: response regulator transcription factor [SAR202 cluster bacterium]|nr:response regulator transcription factor [SAR202 cluster bacterium]
MATRVLVVEDDPNTADLVKMYLARDGYEVSVARDGAEGLRRARQDSPDLLVLDLMLPRMDGMEVCRAIRQESDVAIVMLTARFSEEDRLAGLDLGADDYVTKPFSPRELAARVRAVLRRTAKDAAEQKGAELKHGDVRVDMTNKAAYLGGTPLKLTATEFRMLVMFIREPGRVFSRDEIIDKVFGYDFDGLDRTVDAHVSHLRRKLQPAKDSRKHISTVYDMGYRFGNDQVVS